MLGGGSLDLLDQFLVALSLGRGGDKGDELCQVLAEFGDIGDLIEDVGLSLLWKTNPVRELVIYGKARESTIQDISLDIVQV